VNLKEKSLQIKPFGSSLPSGIMFQLTFSDQSMSEVNTLDHAGQLELMANLSSLTSDILSAEGSRVGQFQREGKLFHRFRIGELRVYFEHNGENLHCHYILHKNTFNDFIVRCKLPVANERDLEKNQSFWEYLDSLGKKPSRKKHSDNM
ncbi:uncharacterized protein METZ01_LOCUS372663, partial [marine metagenome]